MLVANRNVARARVMLDAEGKPPAGYLTPDIYNSWMRCIALGLDTRRPPPAHVVSAAELRQEQQRMSLVRGLALAEMHTLHQQIAGTNFMIAFATPKGLLLDIVSDPSFSGTPDGAAIRPGSLWNEEHCGTNGLGTTAFLQRAVVVHGDEHFFPRYNHLTCAASPVFAPEGDVIGVLDASSNCLSRQTHTQALVAMAATQIENGLFREKYRSAMIIAFHNRGEYLHTLSAGLLALDEDGRLLAANQAARNLLHGLPARPGRRFSDIFRTKFSQFVDDGRRHERQRLQDDVGSHFIVTIENARPVAMMPQAVTARVHESRPPAHSFVSDDPHVATLVRRVEGAARRAMPILIRGETGTGKEQLARHAHAASARTGSFVPVNCAALPESLIEAELFGYAEGAFTGAKKGGSHGLFREADGGTLFLDEIGDMPVALQSVLLRFLDDWTVRPVGGTKKVVDVLLVSATNAPLDAAIARGRFRSDLLYRLNTLEIMLPPLGARADFAQIARHLLHKIDPAARLTDGAVEILVKRNWPGNIRELRNALTRLSLEAEGEVIDAASFETGHGAQGVPVLATDPNLHASLKENLHDLQRNQISEALATFGYNVSRTARKLGISRNTVYRTLRDLALKPGDNHVRAGK